MVVWDQELGKLGSNPFLLFYFWCWKHRFWLAFPCLKFVLRGRFPHRQACGSSLLHLTWWINLSNSGSALGWPLFLTSSLPVMTTGVVVMMVIVIIIQVICCSSWPAIFWFKTQMRGLLWWSTGWDIAFQCWGCRFDPWSGRQDPTCLVAKKIRYETEAILWQFNKYFKMAHL